MGLYERDYAQAARGDAGVVTFANRVYGWMSLGLALTAFVAYSAVWSGVWMRLLPFWWVFAFGTLGIALAINGLLSRLTFGAAAGLFLAYAFVQGLFFGVTLPMYAAAYGGQVIWLAFATASGVSVLALVYGNVTQADLTHVGRLLNFGVMALLGMTLLYFVASFFVTLTWMHLLISYLGLVIFVGLTAYDAQQIRQLSYQAQLNSTAAAKLGLVMALKMYINVIMIFWFLLQILTRRN